MAVKIKGWHIAAVLLIVFLLWYGGYLKFNIQLPQQQQQQPPTSEMVDVTKQLKFVFIDKWAGGSITPSAAYLYDNSLTTLESATSFSSGTWTTSNSYASGTQLWLKVTTTADSTLQWYKIIVPQMGKADAESLTVNPIRIDYHDLPSLTDALRDNYGNSYSDGGSWNITSGGTPGQKTGTLTYSWYVGSDGDGFISSYDPVYNINLKAVVWVELSGTNYEKVILTGFDGALEKGSKMYYYKVIPDTDLVKYKVGNTYVYSGTGSVSFSVDLSGYSGDSADLQIYLYVYSDPQYFATYGSYGPNAVQLAEQTLNLVD